MGAWGAVSASATRRPYWYGRGYEEDEGNERASRAGRPPGHGGRADRAAGQRAHGACVAVACREQRRRGRLRLAAAYPYRARALLAGAGRGVGPAQLFPLGWACRTGL